jgi:hypothetical protein
VGEESVSVKDYIDSRLADRDRAVAAALASNDRRLDGMNEFRDTLKNQQGTFVTRVELFAWIAVTSIIGGALGAVVGHAWK